MHEKKDPGVYFTAQPNFIGSEIFKQMEISGRDTTLKKNSLRHGCVNSTKCCFDVHMT